MECWNVGKWNVGKRKIGEMEKWNVAMKCEASNPLYHI